MARVSMISIVVWGTSFVAASAENRAVRPDAPPAKVNFARERQAALEFIAAAPSRVEGTEDVLLALLNCPEFTFNH